MKLFTVQFHSYHVYCSAYDPRYKEKFCYNGFPRPVVSVDSFAQLITVREGNNTELMYFCI